MNIIKLTDSTVLDKCVGLPPSEGDHHVAQIASLALNILANANKYVQNCRRNSTISVLDLLFPTDLMRG